MNRDTSNGDVVEDYANYLGDCISETKFLDKDNLKEYLKTHLNLFFSECLDGRLLDELDKRVHSLILENSKLNTDRVQMEEQILVSKSRLREHKRVDTAWLARLNYAYKMKGVQIQNNTSEIRKVNDLRKARNIQKANTEDRVLMNVFKSSFREMFGSGAFVEFIRTVESKVYAENENLRKRVSNMLNPNRNDERSVATDADSTTQPTTK